MDGDGRVTAAVADDDEMIMLMENSPRTISFADAAQMEGASARLHSIISHYIRVSSRWNRKITLWSERPSILFYSKCAVPLTVASIRAMGTAIQFYPNQFSMDHKCITIAD